jgi:hypothetical protein
MDETTHEGRLAKLKQWEREVASALRTGMLSRGDAIGHQAQLKRVQRQIAMLSEGEDQP